LRDNTKIHGVFDMGQWIHGQFEDQFQEHSHSAVADVCHVTEYIAAAGKVILDSERAFAWALERKEMLLVRQSETESPVMRQRPASNRRRG